MIRINSQYPTRVKFVKQNVSKAGKPYTSFSIGDLVRDSEPKQYVNYNVTVFDGLQIQDDDKIIITEITQISSREYKGKIYHDLICKAVKAGSDDSGFFG